MNFEQIHAYADGELSSEEKAQFESQLADCKNTQNELQSVRNTKAALQNKCNCEDNQALWKTCQSRFKEIDNAQKTEFIVNKFRWVLAGFVFVAIAGAAILNRINPTMNIGSENFASALSASPSSASTRGGIGASEWVSEQMGIKVNVPNFESKGLKLERMEMLDMKGDSVARITYSDGRYPYTLMVFKGMSNIDGMPMEGKPGLCCGEIGRMNVVAWPENGAVMMFAGVQSPTELAQFVK